MMISKIDWSLAARNLLRNPRRSLSTIIALAMGLTAIALFNGFENDLRDTMLTAVVRSGGHLQIQHRDYFLFGSGNPTTYAIENDKAIIEALNSDTSLSRMVEVITPMLRFGGLAGNFEAGISRPVLVNGYIADDLARMRHWNEFSIPSSNRVVALNGASADAAVIGVGLARVLQLCKPFNVSDCNPTEEAAQPQPDGKARSLPSDIASLAQIEVQHANASVSAQRSNSPRLELLAGGSRGAPNVAALVVVAAEQQVFKELDDVSILIHLAQAQRLVFAKDRPKVTAIMVLLRRSASLTQARARLDDLMTRAAGGQPLVVRDFKELNPFYTQSERMFDFIFGFIFVLIGGIVLFTVGNTMNMVVVERTVEIGTLRAIGLRRQGIVRMFLIEGFLLGCVGVITGLLVSLVTSTIINHAGVTWLPPGGAEWLPLQLRMLGDRSYVPTAAFLLVIVATLSATWPAWRGAEAKIVDALRHA